MERRNNPVPGSTAPLAMEPISKQQLHLVSQHLTLGYCLNGTQSLAATFRDCEKPARFPLRQPRIRRTLHQTKTSRFVRPIPWHGLAQETCTRWFPAPIPGLVRCSALESRSVGTHPLRAPITVLPTGTTFANPKSRTFACPRLLTKMFAGLMSL